MFGFATVIAAPIPLAGLSFGIGSALGLTLIAILVGAVFFIVRDAASPSRSARLSIVPSSGVRVVEPVRESSRRNEPSMAA